MAKPTYTEISDAIDAMVKAIVANHQERHQGYSTTSGMAWAAASGTLISILTDAVAQCPARAQQEFMRRFEERRVEHEQETIIQRLKR